MAAMKPKLANLEDVTPSWLLGARAVRASDGFSSQVLWENPDSGASTDDLCIRVQQVSPAYVGPVLEKLRLLIDTASDVR
jgi:hypothetical protein